MEIKFSKVIQSATVFVEHYTITVDGRLNRYHVIEKYTAKSLLRKPPKETLTGVYYKCDSCGVKYKKLTACQEYCITIIKDSLDHRWLHQE